MASKIYPLHNAQLDGPKASEKLVSYIEPCLPRWDGVNWKAVREYLISAGRVPADLDKMEMDDVWMAFATGAEKFIATCGQPDTHERSSSVILPRPAERRKIFALPTQQERLAVDVEHHVVTLDGVRYPVTPEQATIFDILKRAKGGWVPSDDIKNSSGSSIYQIISRLPPELQNIIGRKTGPGGGSRLLVE